MKRFFIMLICLVGAMTAAFAQDSYTLVIKDDNSAATTTQKAWTWNEHPGNLIFSVGAPSITTMIVSAGDCPHYNGSYSIRYDYNLLRWLAVGGRLSYDGVRYTDYFTQGGTDYSYSAACHYGSLQMEVLFTYVNREHVQLYSGMTLGLMYYFKRDINTSSMQYYWNSNLAVAGGVIPIGIHVGGRTAYAMAEVSIGTESLMSLGLGFHL